MVGGTTAECAAVWCCIPCVVVDMLVQAVYKVPAELCRNALRKRRSRLAKNGLLPESPQSSFWEDSVLRMHRHLSPVINVETAVEADEDAAELEKEMWDKFSGAGFWRSPSQRSEVSQL